MNNTFSKEEAIGFLSSFINGEINSYELNKSIINILINKVIVKTKDKKITVVYNAINNSQVSEPFSIERSSTNCYFGGDDGILFKCLLFIQYALERFKKLILDSILLLNPNILI